jgi:hypothetical protein
MVDRHFDELATRTLVVEAPINARALDRRHIDSARRL